MIFFQISLNFHRWGGGKAIYHWDQRYSKSTSSMNLNVNFSIYFLAVCFLTESSTTPNPHCRGPIWLTKLYTGLVHKNVWRNKHLKCYLFLKSFLWDRLFSYKSICFGMKYLKNQVKSIQLVTARPTVCGSPVSHRLKWSMMQLPSWPGNVRICHYCDFRGAFVPHLPPVGHCWLTFVGHLWSKDSGG